MEVLQAVRLAKNEYMLEPNVTTTRTHIIVKLSFNNNTNASGFVSRIKGSVPQIIENDLQIIIKYPIF